MAVAVDRRGNAYVTGGTNSKEFADSNSANSRVPGKDLDAFTAKLDAAGRKLEYVLRFGGSYGSEFRNSQRGKEFGTDIAVDSAGTAYVVGDTDSMDFPIRGEAPPLLQGGEIAFIVRIDAAGKELLSGAYLGNGSSVAAVALDRSGAPHVTGNISKEAGTATGPRMFMAKLTPDLHRVVYLSPIVNASAKNRILDYALDIAIDSLGNTYIVGLTESPAGFPIRNPLQKPFLGRQDAFLIIFDSSGAALLSSTIGGGAQDVGTGVAVDGSGNVYISGTTLDGSSSPFPAGKTLGEVRHGVYFQDRSAIREGGPGAASKFHRDGICKDSTWRIRTGLSRRTRTVRFELGRSSCANHEGFRDRKV